MMTSPPIASRENQWFQRFRRALDVHDEEIVLEGPKQIRDAIAGGWDPLAVATTAAAAEGLASLIPAPLILTDRLFEKLAETRTSQGALALFKRPRWNIVSLLALRRPLIALDSVQDPGNVGTIVRNAAAFDMGGILILGDTADPFSPRSIRASSGAILGIGVCEITGEELTAIAEPSGYTLFAAAGGNTSIGEVPETSILIFGNEGQGVSSQLLRAARQLSVPMSARVESLNVASAAAILLSRLYERRQASSNGVNFTGIHPAEPSGRQS